MKNRTFCIGDIHGHFELLEDLMDKLYQDHKMDLKKDTLVVLGDMVDGGKDSKSVLDWAIIHKELHPNNFFPICGNHETLLLDALNPKHPLYNDYYLWYRQGGMDTADSFKPAQSLGFSPYEISMMKPKDVITKEYVDFMKGLPLYYENDDYFFVHGGLIPNKTIEEHKKDVQSFRSDRIKEGDTAMEMLWTREPFMSSLYDWKKKVVFGHTAMEYPKTMSNKIGIDTVQMVARDPARFSGHLTAVILPDEEFVQSKDFNYEN